MLRRILQILVFTLPIVKYIVLYSCTEHISSPEKEIETKKETRPSNEEDPRKEKNNSPVQKTIIPKQSKADSIQRTITRTASPLANAKVRRHFIKKIISIGMGPGTDQLGYDGTSPGNQIGPSSFAVDENERIYILDPLKDRILVYFRGIRENDIPLPKGLTNGELQSLDIRILPTGEVIVADGEADLLWVLDRIGKQKKSLPIPGRFFGRMNVQPDGIWIRGLYDLYPIMDAKQRRPSNPLPSLPIGILSRDGKWLLSWKENRGSSTLTLILCDREKMYNKPGQIIKNYSSANKHLYDRCLASKHHIKDIKYNSPIFGWTGGYTDAKGCTHIITFHDLKKAGKFGTEDYLTTLSPNLEVLRRTRFPVSKMPGGADNTARIVDVTANGNVYILSFSKNYKRAYITRYSYK